MGETQQLLTHSRQDCFKVCRRKHWFAYEQRLRPATDAKALRMGGAYHDALEVLAKAGTLAAACDVVHDTYYVKPEFYEQLEWDYERETVLRMVCGYEWRWLGAPLKHIAAEHEFVLPLLNPDTGRPTPSFKLAGKIDGIVELEDGRLAVMEHKLLGEDLESDSPLWRRLRIDHQISLYVLAARRLGFPVDCVLYNVTRKPTIYPTDIALLDDLGVKIVLDARGNRVKNESNGFYRQTGDSSKGYVLQKRPMTAEEWGEKLNADIMERPGFYFVRMEIPRLDQDLKEYEVELWDIQKSIRDAQLNDRHYRTCNRETCAWCPYFEVCTTGFDPAGPVPDGFVRLSDPHPELGRMNDVNSNSAGDGTEAGAIATPSESAACH